MLVAVALLAPSLVSPWQANRRHVIESAAAILPVAVSAAPATAVPSYQSSVTLSDGSTFPLASFGLQIYDDAMAEKLTLQALEAGFRNFFASVLARNQVGFARAIKRSGVPREELFICGSVVSNRGVHCVRTRDRTLLAPTAKLTARPHRAQPSMWTRRTS